MPTLHHCYTDRHGTYYLRVKLPRDIASDSVQLEIRLSLRTKRSRLAAQRSAVALCRVQQAFECIRMTMTQDHPDQPSEDDKGRIWANLLERHDGNDNEAQKSLINFAIRWIKNWRPDHVDKLHKIYSTDSLEEIGFADLLTSSRGAVTPENVASEPMLAVVQPSPELIAGSSTNNVLMVSMTCAYVIEEFVIENGKHWDNVKDEISRLLVLQRLMEHVVGARRLIDLGSGDWYVIYRMISYLPKWTTEKNFLQRIDGIVQDVQAGLPPDESKHIVRGTLAEMQQRMKALCKLSHGRECSRRDFLSSAKTSKPTKHEKTENKYQTMEPEEIRALLHGHLYQAETVYLDRRTKYYEFRFWMLPLALYMGMRQKEIAQLYIEDLKSDDGGIIYLHVTDEGEGKAKSVKSAASRRKVPLHQSLIDAGFLDYVDDLRGKQQKYIFPELWLAITGEALTAVASSRINKYFNDDKRNSYIKSCGITRRKVVFHSARHTFVDCLRQCGVDDLKIADIVGHEKGLITAHYGNGTPLKTLKAVIDQLDYGPAGSLEHISLETYRSKHLAKPRGRRKKV